MPVLEANYVCLSYQGQLHYFATYLGVPILAGFWGVPRVIPQPLRPRMNEKTQYNNQMVWEGDFYWWGMEMAFVFGQQAMIFITFWVVKLGVT